MAPAQLLVALHRRGGFSSRHLSKPGLGEVALVVNAGETPGKQEPRLQLMMSVVFPQDCVAGMENTTSP